MSNTYVIRQMAYYYDDSSLCCDGDGAVEAVFHDYAKAYDAWRQKEIAQFRTVWLGYYEVVRVRERNGIDIEDVLGEYFMENFNMSILSKDGSIEMHITIPPFATDEQVWEIKLLSGVQFYSLSTFIDTPIFYAIRDNTYEIPYLLGMNNDTPNIYNTYEEALQRLQDDIIYMVPLKGTPKELSDMPTIMMDMVNRYSFLKYDPIKEELEIWGRESDIPVDMAKVVEFFETLKVKPYSIEKLTLADLQQLNIKKYIHYTP